MKTSDLIERIQSCYSRGLPNLRPHDWAEDRFFIAVREKLPDYVVQNWTQFDYSCCNSFAIQKDSAPATYRAFLWISFVAPIYRLFIETRIRISAEKAESDFTASAETIRAWLDRKGFDALSDEQGETVVPGVTLSLSESATIGKCLFHDYEAL